VRRRFGARPARITAPPSAIGPAAVEVRPRALRLAEGVCASFAITGYPAEVPLGWLEPLLTDPGRVDVALHIEPIPPAVAADRLRRQLARLEAGSRANRERGRLADFEAEAAADDATELAARLARGQGKLFRAGLYVTVHARDDDELHAECERVRALAASLLLDAKPASWRSLQGWVTTLPFGVDALRMRRTMDTDALAAAFPFTSPDLAAPATDSAVLYGLNTASSSLVIWDRFALDNYNAVILARTGAGKSFFTKLELLRSLYTGVEAAVIDPENEYTRLCEAVGGTHIRLGAPGVRLNPFDLPPGAGRQADALTRRALFLHTVIAVLLGEQPSPAERAALDRSIVATYTRAGITTDPRTWARPAPLLKDLAVVLAGDSDPAAVALGSRLAPYVTGSWRGLFDGPATARPEGHLVVFSLRDLPDELRTLGTLLTLDAIWRRVCDPATRRRRLVVVDEGWLLMREREGARFLFRLAKSARKHWCGLTVVTQDAADVLGSDLGRAVVSNASTQILMRQAPQAIDQVADAFHLSGGERAFLLSAERGQALLAAGAQRVGFQAIASPTEYQLITTDPADLAELDGEPDPYPEGDIPLEQS
jgi:type IV secretory pathway VirB4 component